MKAMVRFYGSSVTPRRLEGWSARFGSKAESQIDESLVYCVVNLVMLH